MSDKNIDVDDLNKYESEIIDTDDIAGADIKINPDFYIHNAIVKAQGALINPNVQEGFLQFRVLVEHLETLALASNRLPIDYSARVTEFQQDAGYLAEHSTLVKSVLLSNKKLELILKQVFISKTATNILKA